MKNLVSIVIFLTGLYFHAAAENRVFNVHCGLSENTVRSIIQDSTGYMWFATKDGLCRYNGKDFTSYGSSSESSNSSPLNIEALLLHEDGKRIWVASRTALVLFDPKDTSISSITADTGCGSTKIRSCLSVCYDLDRNLWVGTGTGLYMMEHQSGKWRLYTHKEYNQLLSDRITKIFCDSRGILWIGTEMGLVRHDHLSDSFKPISTNLGHDVNITTISEDREGNIWIGTWYDGIALLDIKKSHMSFCRLNMTPERVRAIFHKSPVEMFICSDSGLFLYDKRSGDISPFKFEEWMPDKSYYSFYEDREGGYWIGTYFNGVCYISPKSRNMWTFSPGTNCAVSQFCELPDKSILIATENYGLISFDPVENKVYPAPYQPACDNIHALCTNGKDLWVGTFGKGLVRIDMDSGITRSYTSDEPNSIPNNHIYSLCRTKDDDLIVGTMRGACIYSDQTGMFRRIDKLGDKFIYDIAEDNYGKIWFATYGSGAYCLDTETGVWREYKSAESPDSLCGNYVIRLHIDSKDRLWFCTEGKGVCRYDYRQDRFVVPEYKTANGKLPNSVVFGILEDNEGKLWMSTNNGLIKYDESTGECRQYSYSDGVQSKQFNYRSSFRSSDGKLYFGGIDGFNTFYPDKLFENTTRPGISANISYGSGKAKTYLSCSDSSTVIIPRNIRSFSLNLECLSFVSSDNNAFKYKFNGNPWTYTQNPEVSFVNMKPGKYAISVKAINGDGYESSGECRFNLHIQPPIFHTVFAKIIYAILAGALIWLLIASRIRRKNMEMIRKFEAMKLKNEQESYHAKIQFFTQIAHEIKTPVTLIKAPLEIIKKSRSWDDETARNLDIIGTNTDRLMSLIRELLDFKKINKEGYKLNIETIDAVIVAKETIKSFAVSDEETPQICFSSTSDSIICNADSEALIKIISNLVSNAMRFAREKIDIILDRPVIDQTSYLRITVKDDGPGIPYGDREKIFDAFYQSTDQSAVQRSKGVGLGLSLVRLLVEKHNGKVYINGEYTEGCEIDVEIPCKCINEAESTSAIHDAAQIREEDSGAGGGQKTRILIVEDNLSLLKFLCDNISGSTYTPTGARDGNEAIEMLGKQDYDIIISDIAMPNMDGFELLRKVRSDNMLCHIPFILLSAESSIESKIEGLEKGADAYIEKPFSITHLYAVIENLISSRRLLQKKFSTEPLEKYNTSGMSEYDTEWLKKLDSLIHAGMNDEGFSIDRLADQLHMSRSYLQRKLRGLINMSTNDYIKLIKLKKAAELLSEGHYRINEVCYIVGFNNPSYFSNCFHKQFGVLPKDFATSHHSPDKNKKI